MTLSQTDEPVRNTPTIFHTGVLDERHSNHIHTFACMWNLCGLYVMGGWLPCLFAWE